MMMKVSKMSKWNNRIVEKQKILYFRGRAEGGDLNYSFLLNC